MEVKVNVGDKTYYLVNDAYSIALAEKVSVVNRETGKPEDKMVQFKWYADIAQAFKAVLQMKVGVSQAKTLKQLHKAIQDARKELSAEWR